MSPQYMEKLGHVEVAPGVYGSWSSYESLQFSPGYGGCALCGPVQSRRVRSRFYASGLDARFGDHGTDDPLVEPLI